MKSIALDDLPVVGALDRDITPTGVSFRRLPVWSRPQITDIAFATMAMFPAGVRLAMITDATEVELDVMPTRIKVGARQPGPAVFDVRVNGQAAASHASDGGSLLVVDMKTMATEFIVGEAVTVRFDQVTNGTPQQVELWLPHNCMVEIQAMRVSAGATVSPVADTRPRWIHYGSSISHCLEAIEPTATWPAISAHLAGVNLQNLAFAGQCMLDQTLARTIRDLPADAISLKIGINLVNADSMRERTFGPALHGFLDTIRDGHPDTPITLVTPIICPAVEHHPGPTVLNENGRYGVPPRSAELSIGALTLQLIRSIEAQVVAVRQAQGDHNLHLLDGLALFGADDAVDLPDDLHPSPEGYRRIGHRFHELAFTGSGPFAHLAAG